MRIQAIEKENFVILNMKYFIFNLVVMSLGGIENLNFHLKKKKKKIC